MLGYVHLTAGRPVLERRAAAGMTYWALLAAQILARRFRRLRLETGAGQEALERQLLRQLGLTNGGGAAAVTVTFGPQAREGCAVYLTPDCARRQRVDYIWRDGESPAPEEPLLAALHRAGRLPDVGVKSAGVCADNGDVLSLTCCDAAAAENALAVVSYHMNSGIVVFVNGICAVEATLVVNAELLAELLELAGSAADA